MIFKQKVKYDDFVIIAYQFGYSTFNSTVSFLEENNISFSKSNLFIVLETTIATLFGKKINNFNIVDDINKIVYEAYKEEDKSNMISYSMYLIPEIIDMVQRPLIKDLVDYILNEITDDNGNSIKIDIVAKLCDVFYAINQEINNIVNNIKIIH